MKIALRITLGALLLFGAFVLGARYGAEAMYQLNGQSMAALSYVKLHQLKTNKLSELEATLHFEIDHELVNYINGSNHSLRFLWPELNNHKSQILLQAIEYKKSNPWTFLGIKDINLIQSEDLKSYRNDELLLNEYINSF
jgi:hypothetical protein